MDINTFPFQFTHDWISGYFPTWKRLIPCKHDMRILEIGCYEGRSTIWFIQNFPKCHVTCIDHFEGGSDHNELGIDFSLVEHRFTCNTLPWSNQVRLYQMHSDVALRSLHEDVGPSCFDLVLIDGSHMACDVLNDTVLSWPLLVKGGIMIFDDYGWGSGRPAHQTPKPAIDAFRACFHLYFDVLEDGYQFICRKTRH